MGRPSKVDYRQWVSAPPRGERWSAGLGESGDKFSGKINYTPGPQRDEDPPGSEPVDWSWGDLYPDAES